jgi:hypothetical protein
MSVESGRKRKSEDALQEELSSKDEDSKQPIKKQKLQEESSMEDSLDSNSEDEKPMDVDSNKKSDSQKKKRTRIDRTPSKEYIIMRFEKTPHDLLEEIIVDLATKDVQKVAPGASGCFIPNELIRIYPSEAEVKAERRKYRKIYSQDPKNIERRRAKANSPKEIEKRKKMNENEEAKQRKKECAAARRKMLAELKETNPETYEALRGKYVKPLPPKPRKKKEKKTPEAKEDNEKPSISVEQQ